MKVLLLVVAVAVLFLAAIWLLQEHLIFFPQPLVSTSHLPRDAEAIEVRVSDGTVLRGWMRKARTSPAPLLLYFSGNAEEVSWTLADRRWPDDWAIAAVNYRGYGESQGRPGEAALRSDALAIYDALASRRDIRPDHIAVMGRSLGTGVAIHVASARRVVATILVSPYDSLVAIGSGHYPWLPVRWMLKHRFDVLPLARNAEGPMLAIVADDDSIIPRRHSRALFEAWRGTKQWREIARTDHNTLSTPDAFWQEIRSFLDAQNR